MVGEEDKLLIYFENEEHLVRRLGAAVVSLWSDIPIGLQHKLIEQAERVFDENETDEVVRQIRQLLSHYALEA
jgi:hypothetical protein